MVAMAPHRPLVNLNEGLDEPPAVTTRHHVVQGHGGHGLCLQNLPDPGDFPVPDWMVAVTEGPDPVPGDPRGVLRPGLEPEAEDDINIIRSYVLDFRVREWHRPSTFE